MNTTDQVMIRLIATSMKGIHSYRWTTPLTNKLLDVKARVFITVKYEFLYSKNPTSTGQAYSYDSAMQVQ